MLNEHHLDKKILNLPERINYVVTQSRPVERGVSKEEREELHKFLLEQKSHLSNLITIHQSIQN